MFKSCCWHAISLSVYYRSAYSYQWKMPIVRSLPGDSIKYWKNQRQTFLRIVWLIRGTSRAAKTKPVNPAEVVAEVRTQVS